MVRGLPMHEGSFLNEGAITKQGRNEQGGVSSPLFFFENLKESHLNSFHSRF